MLSTTYRASHLVLRRLPGLLRGLATASSTPTLKETLRAAIPTRLSTIKSLRATGSHPIGTLTVSQVLSGMRGLPSMLWCSSSLDPQEGIHFHGKSIAECAKELPKSKSGVMLPEAMFWFLLTGNIPTEVQTKTLSRELAAKAQLPDFTRNLILSFPKDLHPMTAFAMAVASLSRDSVFAQRYASGMPKAEYWEATFDDVISLLAKLPTTAATIYARNYGTAEAIPEADADGDWAYNFARMLGKGGKENESFQDALRLYLALHGDHEGGNVSAHTTHLVGSALSDPFLSYSAGLAGLAGPLHGLATQEVLRWTLQLKDAIPKNATDSDITKYLWTTLNSGRVIPGYGHAVLRVPDPRFSTLMTFAKSRPEIASDPLFQLVERVSNLAPGVLEKHGKTKNPYPNVDSASGVLFWHYGFRETLYYTATFGVSRGLGPLAQMVWDRALELPIERPKSITIEELQRAIAK